MNYNDRKLYLFSCFLVFSTKASIFKFQFILQLSGNI